MTEGFNFIDKFLDGQKFFDEHKDVKNLALEVWVKECCGYLNDIYAQIPAWQLNELIRRELDKVEEKTSLTAFLFSRMNIFNVQLNRHGALIQQMNAHIQKQNEVIRQLQAQLKK